LQRGRELLLLVDEQQEKALNALRVLGTIDYQTGRLEPALQKLAAAREGLTGVYGAESPDVQGASYWLAAALLDAGRVHEAAALVESLEPDALRASLGGPGWSARLDALRAGVLMLQGRAEEGDTLLHAAIVELEQERVPAWVIESLRSKIAR